MPLSVFGLTCQDINGAYLFSQEPNPVYLGFFGTQFASESIYNQFGTYGSQFNSLSVRNTFGTYGSQFSTYSHMNQFTQTPPMILKDGILLGYLTVNPTINKGLALATIDAVCSFTATSPAFPAPPPPPLPPALVDASDGLYPDRIIINWTQSENSTGYYLYCAATPAGPPIYIGTYSVPPAVHSPLSPYNNYYYWVSAYNVHGESSLTGPTEGSTFFEPVKILNGDKYLDIDDAYTDAINEDVIMVCMGTFPDSQVFNLNKKITLKGGYDYNFSSNGGVTQITPSITISNGTVTIENITIK